MSSVVFFPEVRLDRFGFYDTARAVRPEWPLSRERRRVKVYRYLNCFVKTQVFETVVPLMSIAYYRSYATATNLLITHCTFVLSLLTGSESIVIINQKCNFYFCLLCLVCTFERLVSDEITVDLL